MEVWKPVVGYEDYYEVSDRGRVRSLDREIECEGLYRPIKKKYRGKKLKPYVNPLGQTAIVLSRDGVVRRFLVHRLVLEAFIGPCPSGQECAHLDGNPRNNGLENLIWTTHKENEFHKKIHGTNNAGIKHPLSRLTQNEVLEIRERRESGELAKDLAKEFGVARQYISKIALRQRWASI